MDCTYHLFRPISIRRVWLCCPKWVSCPTCVGLWGKCDVFNDGSAHRRRHSSLSLGSRAWGRCLRGSGKHAEAQAGQVFTGGPGTWPFIGKGFRTGSALTTDGSRYGVQVPVVLRFCGSVGRRGGSEPLVPGPAGGRRSLCCACFSCRTCGLGPAVPGKQRSVLLGTGRGHLELVLRLRLAVGEMACCSARPRACESRKTGRPGIAIASCGTILVFPGLGVLIVLYMDEESSYRPHRLF